MRRDQVRRVEAFEDPTELTDGEAEVERLLDGPAGVRSEPPFVPDRVRRPPLGPHRASVTDALGWDL